MTQGTGVWTLGDAIAKARELAGLEQAQLAQRIGVHRNSVSRWETGATAPKFAEVVRVALATGQPLDFFGSVVPGPDGPDDVGAPPGIRTQNLRILVRESGGSGRTAPLPRAA